mgnify:CR=1 FL=1
MRSGVSVGNGKLPVAVDCMGGDRGPACVVAGAVSAVRKNDIPVILVGDEALLAEELSKNKATSEKISIKHAPQFVTMDDSPSVVLRGKTDSSVRIAFELMKEGAVSGVVSPGNTGAMMAAGLAVCGTIPGVSRPAIATPIPRASSSIPTILLDSGANVDCRPEQLVQFAIMGDCYARLLTANDSPRVAILSNGSESSKGTDLLRETAERLRSFEDLNFIGFVEGRDVPAGNTDVIVCDGLVGNIVLKTIEGSARLVANAIKSESESSIATKIGLLFTKRALKRIFKEKLDPSYHGGAPLLGLNGVGIVCHGAAGARAIENAVRVADNLAAQGMVGAISSQLKRAHGVHSVNLAKRVGKISL